MPTQEPLVLTGLSLWDGDKLLDADCIRLEAGRINAIGDRAAVAAGGTAARVVDAGGLWAIPGLMDAHVHMTLDPSRRNPPGADELPDWEPMVARAKAMVCAGITTARDLGGGAWRELALRDAIERGEIPGPTLHCAGQPITSLGGHCHFWGGEADSIEAIDTIIDRQVAHGVDLIKIMASGGVMTRDSKPSAAQFEQPLIDAVVQGAARYDLRVAAHCHSTTAIDRASQAGVRTVEHCSWVSDEGWGKGYDPAVAQRMARQGIWVSPTINRGWQRHLANPDSTRRDQLREIFTAMRALGVKLIASTDAGIPGVRHEDLPLALPVFAALANLTPEETLRAATSDAAEAIEATDAGWLAIGKRADLLLLKANPLEDLATLAEPVEVFARGAAQLDAFS